nr:hypothetical protein [uncultured Marvinbryantia sp.]
MIPKELLESAAEKVDSFLLLPVLEQLAYAAKALFDVVILFLKGMVVIAIIGAIMVVALIIRELAYELRNRRKKK